MAVEKKDRASTGILLQSVTSRLILEEIALAFQLLVGIHTYLGKGRNI